ncbi:histidine kinase [Sphingobacterium shayense]|uniref:sensor histidine kinase n=1 Tax=Sphingobacterium shayense TaxID=626343 RepID=UPI001551F6FB|nr:histidine kinase [Sphingobacterium shayense]NQD71616.1 histidine kinase [Sphingobacterium shayense]
MTINYFFKTSSSIQFIFWPIYFLLMVFVNSELRPEGSFLATLYGFLILVFFVNFGLFIVYVILMKAPLKWLQFLLLPVMLIVYVAFLYTAVVIFPSFAPNKSAIEPASSANVLFIKLLDKSVGIFAFVGAMAFFIVSRYKEKMLNEAEKNRLREELARKDMEFASLSMEVTPHFLSTELNEIRNECEQGRPEVGDRVAQLAELMVYKLKTAGNVTKTVPIDLELNYLEKYLATVRSRFPDSIVDFQVEGSPMGPRIIPGALISIMQNVFKHGAFKGPDNAVVARLQVDDSRILFTCSNRINKSQDTLTSTRLGIENIRKRLDLAFPGEHRFEVSITEDEKFYVELEINEK